MHPSDPPGAPEQADTQLHAVLAMDLETGAGERLRLDVGVRYDESDPLVVQLHFNPPTAAPLVWTVSRELLLDGLDRPSGQGDVLVRPLDGPEVLIVLRSPCGEARLYAPAAALEAVLLRTDLLVPVGEELPPGALERELSLLLPPTGP